MIRFLRLLSVLAALSLLAACAVTPLQPLPATHPASPQAAEAPARPMSGRLPMDEPTRTTETLLGGAGNTQPPAPKDSSDMGDMPGMSH